MCPRRAFAGVPDDSGRHAGRSLCREHHSGDVHQQRRAVAAHVLSNAHYYRNPIYNYQIPLASDTHTDSYRAQLQKSIGNKNYVNGSFVFTDSRQSNPNIFGFLDTSKTLNASLNASWYHRITQRLSTNASYNFSRPASPATCRMRRTTARRSSGLLPVALRACTTVTAPTTGRRRTRFPSRYSGTSSVTT